MTVGDIINYGWSKINDIIFKYWYELVLLISNKI